jgi:kynurenine formamidase
MTSPSRDFEFKSVGAKLSNWGRWGEDDEIGTVNFITPARRAAAAALVRTGKVFALGMPFDANGPQPARGTRFNPIHRMTKLLTDASAPDGFSASDDIITMPLQCGTQWDGLTHVSYDGYAYNGVPNSAVTAVDGATRNSFPKVVSRLIGRGVLLDIAAAKGVQRLDFSQEVTADDLNAAESDQGVRAGSGDILLVRTGWYQHYLSGEMDLYLSQRSPGLGISACEWLHDREIAAVAADNFAVEVMPSTEPGTVVPLHLVLIRDMGMTLGEMFNLEELAADCASDRVYEFLFSGIGLDITGSVGSPVTPVVVK